MPCWNHANPLTFHRASGDMEHMYRFTRQASIELKSFPDPGPEDRTGPSLSRGSLYTLLATVTGEDLAPEVLAQLQSVEADGWYSGQVFETLLDQLEAKDNTLPEMLGRNIYFMFRTALQQIGFLSATQLLAGLPAIWLFATRGDSGVWRTRTLGERHFHVEAEQPYNCMFEAGAVRGFIESFDGRDVTIKHGGCMRHGDAFCTFDVRWNE